MYDGGNLSLSPSGAEESTLRRWYREFNHKMKGWSGLLYGKVMEFRNQLLGLIQLSGHPLERLKQILSMLPELPLRWTVLVKVLWWINPSHPLSLG